MKTYRTTVIWGIIVFISIMIFATQVILKGRDEEIIVYGIGTGIAAFCSFFFIFSAGTEKGKLKYGGKAIPISSLEPGTTYKVLSIYIDESGKGKLTYLFLESVENENRFWYVGSDQWLPEEDLKVDYKVIVNEENHLKILKEE